MKPIHVITIIIGVIFSMALVGLYVWVVYDLIMALETPMETKSILIRVAIFFVITYITVIILSKE